MRPRLLYADEKGRIREHPKLLMAIGRSGINMPPDESELTPLPKESELFFLPGRSAIGIDPDSGESVKIKGLAVSAFAAPGYTLSATPLYKELKDHPMLPLFAYGAVGYAKKRFWICAVNVDEDKRQQFSRIPWSKILRDGDNLLARYPKNRLIHHIIKNCVEKYGCPAAKNFALGRFEAPLPTSQTCNAHCIGCISKLQDNGAAKVTPQCRIAFTPTSDEIVEVMRIHEAREREKPIFSFGQGCEGDPLMNWRLLEESILKFRDSSGHASIDKGTINCNTNASRPEAVAKLCKAGLTSMRVSLNSAQPALYNAYYRPKEYDFTQVWESIRTASSAGVFVSLNLLFFPGITDTIEELEHLSALCANAGVSMIQWRNLNVDPGWYGNYMGKIQKDSSPMGLRKFMILLKEACPWLRYGYFNPWLGARAANVYSPD